MLHPNHSQPNQEQLKSEFPQGNCQNCGKILSKDRYVYCAECTRISGPESVAAKKRYTVEYNERQKQAIETYRHVHSPEVLSRLTNGNGEKKEMQQPAQQNSLPSQSKPIITDEDVEKQKRRSPALRRCQACNGVLSYDHFIYCETCVTSDRDRKQTEGNARRNIVEALATQIQDKAERMEQKEAKEIPIVVQEKTIVDVDFSDREIFESLRGVIYTIKALKHGAKGISAEFVIGDIEIVVSQVKADEK